MLRAQAISVIFAGILLGVSGQASSNPAPPHDSCADEYGWIAKQATPVEVSLAPAFTAAELLQAAMGIHGGMPLKFFPASLVKELESRAELAPGEGLSASSAEKAIHRLTKQIAPDELEVLVGNQLAATRTTLRSQSADIADKQDFKRGWGWRLLPENDPAFQDPRYLAKAQKAAGASGNVMHLKGAQLETYTAFTNAWKRLAPKNAKVPSVFALTGTDANNRTYEIARAAVLHRIKQTSPKERLKLSHLIQDTENEIDSLKKQAADINSSTPPAPKQRALFSKFIKTSEEKLRRLRDREALFQSFEDNPNAKAEDAEILGFAGLYGGVNGKIRRLQSYNSHGNPGNNELLLPGPVSTVWDPKNQQLVAELVKVEDAAIAALRERVLKNKPPIGALMIEPIVGADGVRFFRPEFLQRLRKVCDELEIPIIADEVLTGGGRTGKFLAYQHYEGFEPDFFTFGKGLQVAGVAHVDRGTELGTELANSFSNGPTTLMTHYEEALLKSAQVMNRIAEGDLISNAAKTGKYLLEKLREKEMERVGAGLSAAQKELAAVNSQIAESEAKAGVLAQRDEAEIAKDFRKSITPETKALFDEYQEIKRQFKSHETDPPPRKKYYELRDKLDYFLAKNRKDLTYADVAGNSNDATVADYVRGDLGARVYILKTEKDKLEERAKSFKDQLVEENSSGNPSRGMGMLLYSNENIGVDDALGRLLPPLTTTREDVDRLFQGR